MTIDNVFGDGRCLVKLFMLNTRPNYYEVRVDSSFIDADQDSKIEMLDECVEAAEEQFGIHEWNEDECDKDTWPAVNYDCGYTWSDGVIPDAEEVEA